MEMTDERIVDPKSIRAGTFQGGAPDTVRDAGFYARSREMTLDEFRATRGGAPSTIPERTGVNGPWSAHPRYYEQKCAAEEKLGRSITPDEFMRHFFQPPESAVASGTSIFDP